MSAIPKVPGRIAALLSLIVSLAGCDNSSSSPPIVSPPPPPPPPAQMSFNQFVQDQFVVTADDTDPQSVDGEDFSFDEDATAFDNLLQ